MTRTSKKMSELVRIASRQGGYFTAKQATAVGFSHRSNTYHVKNKDWDRVDRGLFRIPGWPDTPNDEFVRWYLWSGAIGVISHESALSARNIGDLNPARVFMTIPSSSRMRRSNPAVVIARDDIPSDDVEEWEGFRITNPTRSLVDSAPGIDTDQLAQAIRDSIDKGLTTTKTLREEARSSKFSAAHALAIEDALNE